MKKKTHPPSEKKEERQCIRLYEQTGCIVIKFSQAQKAQQTAGIADLLVLVPRLGVSFWHEVKRRKGTQYYRVKSEQSPHQIIFQKNVESVGMTYIVGPLSAGVDKLEELGIVQYATGT